jgi:voltage-gated potassium channel Kch
LLHGRRLETEGAIQAVPETLEASLQLGAIAMTSMGTNSDEVVEIVEELRSDDYIKLGEIIHG